MLTTLFPSQFSVLDQISRQMDRFFESVAPLAQDTGASCTTCWPALNVWKDANSIVAEAEVPGFSMDDIEVLATENSITLKGRRSVSTPENATPIRVERAVMQFERTLELPVEIDANAVQASLVNGVLTISMPLPQSARPRQIPIKSTPSLPAAN